MNDKKQNNLEQTNNDITTKKDNLSKSNNNNIIINNDNQNNYNKVINALIDNDNENKNKNVNKNVNKDNINNNEKNNNHKRDEIDENFYKYKFDNSANIKSINNLFLIKNTIGKENIQPMNKFQNRIKNNFKIKIKPDNNIIESKEEEKDIDIDNKNEENINKNINEENKYYEENNNNKEKKEKKGELDLTYNFDDDVFNVTQEQMKIMDGEVNKIYNKYKKNIQLKNFKMNHPYLKYNNKTNINNNIEFEQSHISKEERQKRLSPIIEKQRLILEKIKKDNISRSHISLSNNNDSDNQTKNKVNKSNKIFYPYKLNQLKNSNGNININVQNNNYALTPSYNNNSIDLNNSNNNNIIYNYKNNINIIRYQNLYNNGSLSSQNRMKFSSNDKINLNNSYKRKINYEPYTLIDYKKKYDNNDRKLLGGLGANIGGEEWVDRQKKLERKIQYSDYVKNDNEIDFKKMNKLKIKVKTDNYDITKTISSKKSSEYSSYDNNRIKTENNIRKNKPIIKLPLIKEKYTNNNKKNNINQNNENSVINKNYKIKDNYQFPVNPLNGNGNEKDLNELIKKYEEYNGEFKL